MSELSETIHSAGERGAPRAQTAHHLPEGFSLFRGSRKLAENPSAVWVLRTPGAHVFHLTQIPASANNPQVTRTAGRWRVSAFYSDYLPVRQTRRIREEHNFSALHSRTRRELVEILVVFYTRYLKPLNLS